MNFAEYYTEFMKCFITLSALFVLVEININAFGYVGISRYFSDNSINGDEFIRSFSYLLIASFVLSSLGLSYEIIFSYRDNLIRYLYIYTMSTLLLFVNMALLCFFILSLFLLIRPFHRKLSSYRVLKITNNVHTFPAIGIIISSSFSIVITLYDIFVKLL